MVHPMARRGPMRSVNSIAATGPLEDLNLRREDIPPVLKAAVVDPYAIPAKFECDPIRQELAELDQVLGKEQEQMDASMLISYKETPGDEESLAPKMPQLPKMPTRDVLIEKSENMAHSQAMGFIRDQTDILPFKRIIRTVTGAEQHARKVDKAKQAGLLRRAFLKGMAQAKFGSKCLAAPMPLEVNAAPLPQKP